MFIVDMLFGFMLGQAAATRSGGAALFVGLPIMIVVLFLSAIGLMHASEWYDASAHARYSFGAWYAYPWHWPGVHVTESA
jgi:hypothetical protein